MTKVFLVEDEVTIREGIKRRLRWEENGLVLVGEASDGELAYGMIQETKPDIVITDIKMPFMDGLELSSLVKKELPSVKIIILSGYDDFDYASRAIKLGVTEYLLKPISADELLETVLRVKDMVESEHREKKLLETFLKEREENQKLARYQFFGELVSGNFSVSELIAKGNRLQIDLSANVYNMFLYKIFKKDFEMMEYREQIIEVENKIEQTAVRYPKVIVFNRITEGVAVVVKGNNSSEVQELVEKCINDIRDVVDQYSDVECFIGVGKEVTRLSEFQKCYKDASKAFAYRFLLEDSQVIYSSDMVDYLIPQNSDIELDSVDITKFDRKTIENFLKSGLKNDIHFFVEEYYQNMGENNMNSILFRQYIIVDMNFAVISFVEDLGWLRENLTEYFGDFGNVSVFIGSVDSTKRYMEMSLDAAVALRDISVSNKYNLMIGKAKRYIMDHYGDGDISLNAVAADVNISPNHFSKVFSQEVGQTFVEYLTETRMTKAREMLRCSTMKTSEIGYEVGYKDPHYFSYLFKKLHGCTPKEYRMKCAD